MTNCQLEKCLHMVKMEKNLSCGEISPPEKCGHKCVLSQSMFFLRNLFCYNLGAFAWRKINPTFLRVENKGQMSGMGKS